MYKIQFFISFLFLSCTTLFAQEPIDSDSIVLPEGMVLDNEDLLKEWSKGGYILTDTGCVSSNANPEFTAETYIDRLTRLPNVIEMPYNEVVKQYIDLYATRLRRSVSVMLGASNFYFPIFEEALEKYNLPLELRYLPVIESALIPTAKSRSGAVGLWQFMIGTARKYQLEENSLIDERMDPIKASEAAARYLSDLYKIYADWTLVIAAYNCGPTQIDRAIRRAGGKRDYWAIYPYLPKETRGYVPAFIAANYIMNYYCDHQLCPLEATLPLATDTIWVQKDVYFEQIADLCQIDINTIRLLNPQYRTNLIPGNTHPCAVRLPLDALNAFIDAKDAIYTHNLAVLRTKRPVVDVDTRNLYVRASKAKASVKKVTKTKARKKTTKKKNTTKSSKKRRNRR